MTLRDFLLFKLNYAKKYLRIEPDTNPYDRLVPPDVSEEGLISLEEFWCQPDPCLN